MSDVTMVEDRRSPLVVLAIVLGALVVLGALWFLVLSPLLAGDDADEDFDPRAGLPEATATEPVEEPTEITEEDTLEALPIETYDIFLSRDPFEPVIPAPSTDGGGTGTDGGGTDTDGDGIPDGGTGDGDGTDGDGDGTDGDGDGAVEHNAVLIDVFVDDSGEARALVRVDDRIYTVGEGDIFADGYAVVAIDGTCVTLTLNGAAFTLCEGGTSPPGDGDGGGDGSDTGPCRGDDEVVCDGRVVTLIDVYVSGGEAVAVVQVDSTLYEVRRGDTFAQNFQVISIDPPCVTLLYGDDAFTLCEGERTLK